jgi:hypothetical protein
MRADDGATVMGGSVGGLPQVAASWRVIHEGSRWGELHRWRLWIVIHEGCSGAGGARGGFMDLDPSRRMMARSPYEASGRDRAELRKGA